MRVLMSLKMIFSIVSFFHLSVQFFFAGMRISFLIVEMKIFESGTVEARGFFSLNFQFVIFLAASSVVSLSEIFTWVDIQCIWKILSFVLILWIKARRMYWSNCCLKILKILIVVWLSMKMFIIVFFEWKSTMFSVKFKSISFFEYIVHSMKKSKKACLLFIIIRVRLFIKMNMMTTNAFIFVFMSLPSM